MQSVQEEYLELLNLVFEVAQSLKGKIASDPYLPHCQQLAIKLFYHAATIYQLRQGTRIPVPYSTQGSSFFDFPSVTVLARTVIETYLTMFEVFFQPATDDDFEFNHALWQLSGFIIREKYPISDLEYQEQMVDSKEEIEEIKERIKNTQKFETLKSGEQRSVLKGKRRRDWSYVAREAGFGEQFIRQVYGYQSGYVHADGLSGAQIESLPTREEQIEFIEIQMRIVQVVLAKMVVQYAEKFPEAQSVCEDNREVFRVAKVLSGAARLLA